jgi:acetyl esterase/lipase
MGVKRFRTRMLFGCMLLLSTLQAIQADGPAELTRTRDVIYGQKYGMALTMDVFTPAKNANGAGVIAVMSGGFFSRPEMIQPVFYNDLVKRGYTVFTVLHGSQPKYTIPEIIADLNRAVRFIRYHAKDYQIDPDRIGIIGASAGGHLSLMQGTAGDKGDPQASDPVEQTSSRVQAVACFFPPTDFMNFGAMGSEHYGDVVGLPFRPAFDYHELDKTQNRFVRVTDKEKLRAISRQVSPITHVTADAAPSLIIHGDKDSLVPIQQAHLIMAKFKEMGVTAKLIVKEGAAHGWVGMDKDIPLLAEWFDKHLRKPTTGKENGKQ